MARVGDHRGILGVPVRRAIPEIAGQQLLEQLDRVYASGEPLVGQEWRILVDASGDGTMDEIYFDVVLVPWFAGDGAVRGVVAQGVDVTAAVVAAAGRRRMRCPSSRMGGRRPR